MRRRLPVLFVRMSGPPGAAADGIEEDAAASPRPPSSRIRGSVTFAPPRRRRSSELTRGTAATPYLRLRLTSGSIQRSS